MQLATLFFTALAALVVGLLAAVLNAVSFVRADNHEPTFGFIARHILFILIYSLGGAVAAVTGTIWLIKAFI
jgi:flagellar biosynthesis protein FliQ